MSLHHCAAGAAALVSLTMLPWLGCASSARPAGEATPRTQPPNPTAAEAVAPSSTAAKPAASARPTAPVQAGRATRAGMVMCDDGPHRVEVELVGVVQLSPAELFGAMRGFELCAAEVWERDVIAIQLAYYDHGYVQAEVEPPSVTVSADGTTVHARIVIREGAQFRVRRFAVYEERGVKRLEPRGGYRQPFRRGEVFRRLELLDEVNRLRRLYADAGYAHVEVHPGIDLDEARHEMDVVVPIRPGALCRFGRIQFVGLARVREATLRPLVAVVTGERYSESALLHAKQVLTGSGEFSRVDVATSDGAATDVVDVTFDVDELPRASEPPAHPGR